MHPFKKKRIWNIGIIIPSIAAVSIRLHFYFEMTFIDVGQGDGIYMETPEGTTVLIDGGSSDNKKLYEYTLEPFLLSKGRKNLDAVIVTHCDNDHISGIRKIFTEDKTDYSRHYCGNHYYCHHRYNSNIHKNRQQLYLEKIKKINRKSSQLY